MKSPINLLQLILTECGNRCRVSTDRDMTYISERFKHEGYSFLAITLSDFGKDFQKSLDEGQISPESFPSFRKRSGLPLLLRGFLENVFDPSSGFLHSLPCIECIRSVRQICLMWAKKKDRPSDRRVRLAFKSFKECESDVRTQSRILLNAQISNSQLFLDFQKVSRLLFAREFSIIDRKIYDGDLVPGHGPGAVAERISQNGKWSAGLWSDRLEHLFPYGRFALSSFRFLLESGVRHLDPGTETPVRVVAVPKTIDTPRIIAIEPVCNQYIQQGIKDGFEDLWDVPSRFSEGYSSHYFIRYSSQLPNQELARKGSELGTFATLDLKEASDRVSNRLVHWLFMDHPHLGEGVQASRSTRADIPGEGIIPLAKFASMGSALTFPIESMVFLTAIFVGIQSALKIPLTRKLIKSFIGQVRVYGDDIIVPTEYTQYVVDSLEAYGFVVNRRKSFWIGQFRESCGKDYYAGEDVSIVRYRRDIPSNIRQTENLVSFVEFRNQLYKAGYWATVKTLDKQIERLIPFPAMQEGSNGLGKVSFLGYESQKWDPRLQRPMVKGVVAVYKKKNDRLSEHWALMKFFNSKRRTNLPSRDSEHLQFAGRPTVVGIKQRWLYPDYGVEGV